jgi:RNase P subunit RPR2
MEESNELSSIKKYVNASQTININDKNEILNLNDLLSVKRYMNASETVNMNDKTRILNTINIFYLNNCKHNIVPDKGCDIKYCNKCEITFNSSYY